MKETHKRRGRPALRIESKQVPLYVRLPYPLLQKTKSEAIKKGSTVTIITREALERGLLSIKEGGGKYEV